MSYFHRPIDTLEEDQERREEHPRSPGSRLADFGDRIARAFTGLERGRVDQLSLEPGHDTERFDVLDDVLDAAENGRFPLDPYGYNRLAVDEHLAELERELDELREAQRPLSINEEIERLGEQTASILVVAHDQAHETTRLAQEQADRCLADAAANAVALTAKATHQLRELDNETDAVWRQRARLLEDARTVGAALIALANDAGDRFPEAEDVKAPEAPTTSPEVPDTGA